METQKSTGLHFGTSLPKVLTYHSAKGLTFETVLLPRLVAKSFPRASPERLERLLYVGITRAIKWVYLSTNTSTPVESLEKVRRLGRTNPPQVTIQVGGSVRVTPPAGGTRRTGDDDILDIL